MPRIDRQHLLTGELFHSEGEIPLQIKLFDKKIPEIEINRDFFMCRKRINFGFFSNQ